MGSDQLLRYAINVNPTRVELELTERCNLSCRFCYNSQKPIDSTLVKKIIHNLVKEGVPEIVLTGGEPLVHKDFTNIVQWCSKVFRKVMLQTNGTLIDDSISKLLATLGIYEVNVSVHGSPRTHDGLTLVHGSHLAAINALKRLIALGIRVSSNFVMTSENIDELGYNIDYLYQIGVRCMTLTRFTPAGTGSKNIDLTLSLEKIINAINLANSMKCSRANLTILLANSMPRCALPDSLSAYCEHCHFGASRFYVDTAGNVMVCGMSRVKVGNIIETSFSEMKSKSPIFANHILGLNVPDTCKQCDDFSRCRGGCRAAAMAHSGDLHGRDPYAVKE